MSYRDVLIHIRANPSLVQKLPEPASEVSPVIEQEDVSREIKAHHTAIREQLETHNSAVMLHMEHETKDKELLRAKVDEQLNTVDAYLTQVDQKVDRILERVNDTSEKRCNEQETSTQPLNRWKESASSYLASCRTIAAAQRFQIVAAGLFVGLLVAIVLLLLLLLSWATPPVFLTAVVTPVTTPSGPSTPGLVMIDIRLIIDRDAQVHYVLLPVSAVDAQASDISDPSPFDVYMTGQQAAETKLSDSAHACGTFDVPQGQKNFTFTISQAADTAECREYTSSMDRAGLDKWAAAQRCSRCPALRSDTAYKVCCLVRMQLHHLP